MTPSEIRRIAETFAASGRRNIPVPISEWRDHEMSKAGEKIADGLIDAAAYARIDKVVRRKDREVPFSPEYDKGFLEGLMAARSLFGAEAKTTVTRGSKSIGKATVKDGKVKRVVKGSSSQKAARTKKAARVVKGLQKNRERAKR